jgi:hypothetical protein
LTSLTYFKGRGSGGKEGYRPLFIILPLSLKGEGDKGGEVNK